MSQAVTHLARLAQCTSPRGGDSPPGPVGRTAHGGPPRDAMSETVQLLTPMKNGGKRKARAFDEMSSVWKRKNLHFISLSGPRAAASRVVCRPHRGARAGSCAKCRKTNERRGSFVKRNKIRDAYVSLKHFTLKCLDILQERRQCRDSS